ncbi:MAG TPA: hypothetical protein VEN99_11450, partial [Acidimicrobiia bacterium]|nr:hypothetical protein [Acidimicrobiia bacterium]
MTAERKGRVAGGLVIQGVEVDGRIVDVRIEAGRVVEVADPSARARGTAPGAGDEVFEAGGGALVPGL